MIKQISKLTLLILLSFTACKNTNKVQSGEGKGEQIVLFEQKGCAHSRCATFELELLDNKQMHLYAIANMDKEGKFVRTLSKDEYSQLVNAFLVLDFAQFDNKYPPESNNDRTSILTVNISGQQKQISNGGSAPDAVKELELMMKSYLDHVGWEPIAD